MSPGSTEKKHFRLVATQPCDRAPYEIPIAVPSSGVEHASPRFNPQALQLEGDKKNDSLKGPWKADATLRLSSQGFPSMPLDQNNPASRSHAAIMPCPSFLLVVKHFLKNGLSLIFPAEQGVMRNRRIFSLPSVPGFYWPKQNSLTLRRRVRGEGELCHCTINSPTP